MTALARRARQLQALFAAEPGGLESLFSQELLARVPPARLAHMFSALFHEYGAAIGFAAMREGRFEYALTSGFKAPVTITLDPAPPHRIAGLLLGNPVPPGASLDDLLGQLARLGQHTSLHIVRLTAAGMAPILAHDSGRTLAIGSASKLYVLLALHAAVARGEANWSDVIALQRRLFSLPSGRLHDWPDGAPLTLHTLATLMISESDNTAADHLIDYLGRARIEQAVRDSGSRAVRKSRPFLSCAEFFKLKRADLAARYVSLNLGQRRAFLDTVVRHEKVTLAALSDSRAVPMLRHIEWFASTADLCAALHSLWSCEDHCVRDILAVRNPFGAVPTGLTYLGYKGGGEPGVGAATVLLQASDGEWYALAICANDLARPIALDRLMGLLQRMLELLATRALKPARKRE